MPPKLKAILTRIPRIDNKENHKTVDDFSKFLLDDSSIGDKHRARFLNTIIEFGIWLGPTTFAQVRKAEVKEFLHVRRTEDGIWERITKDPQGKWVNTYNLKLAFCRRFIRWCYNRDKDEEDEWVTPEWFKIKNEQSDRARKGPYSKRQVWTRDEVLSILKYEPELRNKALITMGWDMYARNHETTSLRIRDINFGVSDVYAEGEIPANTKTGGGEVLFGMSYPYARDWFNQHPRKHDGDAYFFYSLRTCNPYKPLEPQSVRNIFIRLRSRIKQKVERGSLPEDEHKQMADLLNRKAWNPYCMVRHSPLTVAADHQPMTVITKLARWSQNTRQAQRYIKNTIGQDARNEILEAAGIRIPDSKKSQPAVRHCTNPHCGFVNAYEVEICRKCSTPLTDLGFDRARKAQEAKLSVIVEQQTKRMKKEMQQDFKSYDEKAKEQMDKMASEISFYKHQFEAYRNQYGNRPFTRGELEKIELFLERLKNLPDENDDD